MTRLGKYQLHEKLGEGATAEVYRAVDTSLGREVALKILKPGLVADASAFARFVQEARSAAGLFHSNIVTVLETGEEAGRYFIAMRYVPGRSLDRVIRERPLTLEQAVGLARQMGEALDYAHKAGFLHRDVKPSNIIATEDGQYVLTDFGLVRALMTAGLTSHTGAALGTPSYIAPEIWLNQPATQAADQYALACVIYEALTGEVLFAGDTPPAIMTGHIMNEGRLPESSHARIPPAANVVLRRALQKDPSKRYGSVGEFARAFSVSAGAGAAFTSSRVKKQMPEGATRPRSAGSGSKRTLAVAVSKVPDAMHQAGRSLNLRSLKWLGAIGVLIILIVLLVGALKALPATMAPIATVSIPLPASAPPPTTMPTEIVDPKGVSMRLVPAGEFTMGTSAADTVLHAESKPQHVVYLDAFFIDKTEVTNKMYGQCIAGGVCLPAYQNPAEQEFHICDQRYLEYLTSPKYNNYPVLCVTWFEAQAFCAWAGKRLPTEAEWEKAARGTDGRIYPWGNDWNDSNSSPILEGTKPVGTNPKNISPYGVLDMAGNVAEWASDWYDENYYSISPARNPAGPDQGTLKVVKGGSQINGGALWDRADMRGYASRPETFSEEIGFRCAKSAP